MLKNTLLVAGILCSSLAFAAPTPSEVKSVIEHYHGGEAPVLYDVKLCQEVYKSGPEKSNCKIELDPASVAVGTKTMVWMAYLVPKGQKPSILFQTNFKGMTMQAQNVTVAESLRYRTWKSVSLNKVGTWQIPILLEAADGYTELNKLSVNVVDK